jgi:hypothetical protein
MSHSVSGESAKRTHNMMLQNRPEIGPLDSYFGNVLIPGSRTRSDGKKITRLPSSISGRNPHLTGQAFLKSY